MFSKAGYLKFSVIISIMLIILIPFSANASSVTLLKESYGSTVSRLQYQLKILGYYTYPEITGYYGEITQESVIKFQNGQGLEADGIAGASTIAVLEEIYSRHITNGNTSNQPQSLRSGDRGPSIETLQKVLKRKGFYPHPVDGNFGKLTEKAVKEFQEHIGITPDGIVGPSTAGKLNFSLPSRGSYKRIPRTELLTWSKVDKLFNIYTTALVTDVDTGKSFTVYRIGGYYHADSEPYTKYDTAVMKEIYGGKWSWDRKAVIVQIDGRRIAASINGMPHGGQDNYQNGFGGHFCIHFLDSKLHHSGVKDSEHQAMVKKAAK